MRFLLCCCLLCFNVLFCAQAKPTRTVAVVVYTQGANQDEKIVTRVAQTRVEQVLGDNQVTVLDQEKSQELKNSLKQLEDPGFLLTAEDIVRAAEKYKIDGIYRVYIKTGLVAVTEGFFTATANADLRFVDEDAKVNAVAALPMGTVGHPPSDGLTAISATTNAVQRAVDVSLEKAGYKIFDAISPRKLSFDLKPVDIAAMSEFNSTTEMHRLPPKSNREIESFLRTNHADANSITNDELVCSAQSPDKAMIAAGIRVSTRMRMNFTWRTEMRLFDANENKQILVFDVDGGQRRGTTKMLDCMFISNWRYLAAVTGNTLILWDTERGAVMSSVDLSDRSFDSALLSYHRTKFGGFLVVNGNDKKLGFQIVVKGKG